MKPISAEAWQTVADNWRQCVLAMYGHRNSTAFRMAAFGHDLHGANPYAASAELAQAATIGFARSADKWLGLADRRVKFSTFAQRFAFMWLLREGRRAAAKKTNRLTAEAQFVRDRRAREQDAHRPDRGPDVTPYLAVLDPAHKATAVEWMETDLPRAARQPAVRRRMNNTLGKLRRAFAGRK